MKKLFSLSLLTQLFIASLLYPQLTLCETRLTTAYDSKNNTVSISAHNVSFLELMKRIGLQTGIQFHADLSITKTISYEVTNAPLDKSIKQLTKGLSTAITYTEKTQNNESIFIISEIQILPDKQTENKNSVALSTLDSSALAYAHFSDETPSYDETPITNDNYDYMQTRWLTRVSKLPLEERTHVEKIIEVHKKSREKNREKHEKTLLEMKQESEKHEQMINQQEVLLEQNHPERYKLRQDRLQEIRQQIEENR